MASKTVKVVEMVKWANNALSDKNMSSEFRQGVILAIETILFSANAYAGYGFLDHYIEGVTDETRRRYHIEPSLIPVDKTSK